MGIANERHGFYEMLSLIGCDHTLNCPCFFSMISMISVRDSSGYGHSQWGTRFLLNAVSHWLCSHPELSLFVFYDFNDICQGQFWVWAQPMRDTVSIKCCLSLAVLTPWIVPVCFLWLQWYLSGTVLGMGTANERQGFYEMLSLIGCAHTLHSPCFCLWWLVMILVFIAHDPIHG